MILGGRYADFRETPEPLLIEPRAACPRSANVVRHSARNLLRIVSQTVIVMSVVRNISIVNYLATMMTSFACNVTGVEGQTHWMRLLTVSSREADVDLS